MGGDSPGDDRMEAAAKLAIRIAAGDLAARGTVSPDGDSLDALVAALNMLAEELQHERTSRQRAEEQLQDELDAYDNAPALFCSLDAATLTVEKCNRTLTQALGRAKSEIIGYPVVDLFAPEYRGLAERGLADLPLGATSERGEARLLCKSGQHVIVSTAASRVRGSDGRERTRIVWRDITTERRLEAQLFQAQKLEAVGRLSGGVAHDFNNILSVIAGAATLLGDLLAEQGLTSDEVELIQQAVARGASLTSDLLAFSKNQMVEPVATDIRGVIEEAERMIKRLVGDHIRVTSESGPQGLNVLIDPTQLAQVLINLAINARDAMGSSGHLGITSSLLHLDATSADRLALPPGPFAQIQVSDDGCGMPPEVAARAFDPFFTTKPVGSGSGLGLSTCYGIIKQAGGHISISSDVGRGTTVQILLPLSSARPHPPPAKQDAVAQSGKETLLVVEDDETVCMVTRRILERGGYQVITARHGREALDVFERATTHIDMVVTDVAMPIMGGIELGAELRRKRPSIRILYLSGYTANIPLTNEQNGHEIEFLSKPFTQSALLERVRRILDRS